MEINSITIKYGRKDGHFDNGAYDGVETEVAVSADIKRPEKLHAALTALWSDAKSEVKAGVIEVIMPGRKGNPDAGAQIQRVTDAGLIQPTALTVKLGKKISRKRIVRQRDINDTVNAEFSVHADLDPGDRVPEALEVLWSMAERNVDAQVAPALQADRDELEAVYLGLPESYRQQLAAAAD